MKTLLATACLLLSVPIALAEEPAPVRGYASVRIRPTTA